MNDAGFPAAFFALTGHSPFRWQARLFERFAAGEVPDACDIPTGLGKTLVMAIWLIALADQARTGAVSLPRRLVYVVDRRTVVDQATDIAERLRCALKNDVEVLEPIREGLAKLADDSEELASGDRERLLSISTLRGEFADNREWGKDPARAGIIVGTVDMIGSRLLFSGYGVSRKMRPFHAGLLGQDALIVHDEAHLSPAFGRLIDQIAKMQARDQRALRVMDLSATRRGPAEAEEGATFVLTDEEKQDPVVAERLLARKLLRVLPGGELIGAIMDSVRELAGESGKPPRRILVYVRSPDTAQEIAKRIEKELGTKHVATLTGTIRGHERDQMASPSVKPEEIGDDAARRRAVVFKGFLAKPGREPPPETHFLVSTSAGEVGGDLDADHMVCDLTTLDSMIQRLGRVNRLGAGEARIDVVVVTPEKKGADDSPGGQAERIKATTAALEALPLVEDGRHDASPGALRTLVERLGGDGLETCFSKTPRMVGLTDILLDGWAMTRVERLPGRPEVGRWLHGVTSEPPSVHVAWREEVGEIAEADEPEAALKTLFDKHPILARERLRGPLRDDTLGELGKIAKRLGDRKVVLIPAGGDPAPAVLADLLKGDNRRRLAEATIVLPPDAGGLDGQGMLDGSASDRVTDVADSPETLRSAKGEDTRLPARLRVRLEQNTDTGLWSAELLGVGTGGGLAAIEAASLRKAIAEIRKDDRLQGMAEKARIVLAADDEGSATRALLLLTRRGSIDAAEGTQESPIRQPIALSLHNRDVGCEAARIAQLLGLPRELSDAIALAGERHDLGKDRDRWQKAIGHRPPYGDRGDWKPWAKSGGSGFDDSECGAYRHEFGSLREASADDVVRKHPERDLILHLIAAHHGWGRPHFNEEHWDIAEDAGEEENAAVATEALRRFARLQRRFGRWGLAWLESLLRSADYRVSQGIAPTGEDEEEAAA